LTKVQYVKVMCEEMRCTKNYLWCTAFRNVTKTRAQGGKFKIDLVKLVFTACHWKHIIRKQA